MDRKELREGPGCSDQRGGSEPGFRCPHPSLLCPLIISLSQEAIGFLESSPLAPSAVVDERSLASPRQGLCCLEFGDESSMSRAHEYDVSNYRYSVRMALLCCLHLKNCVEGCFGSHKRFSLNETIRMIAAILILFHQDCDSVPCSTLYCRIMHSSRNNVF